MISAMTGLIQDLLNLSVEKQKGLCWFRKIKGRDVASYKVRPRHKGETRGSHERSTEQKAGLLILTVNVSERKDTIFIYGGKK